MAKSKITSSVLQQQQKKFLHQLQLVFGFSKTELHPGVASTSEEIGFCVAQLFHIDPDGNTSSSHFQGFLMFLQHF